ncbi:Proteasome/cyclosome repeat protein, partial [Ostertagia ostertagi]
MPVLFLKSLRSPRSLAKEKEMLIDLFDDWDVLTNTWFEVADCASFIEELSENKDFPARQKAALLASKVAFCLEDYENALNFALAADTHFKLTPRPKSKTVGDKDDEYVNKIIEIAIDSYKRIKNNGEKMDSRLEALINRIFQRNLEKILVASIWLRRQSPRAQSRMARNFLYLCSSAYAQICILNAGICSHSFSVLLLETIQKVTGAKMDVQLRTQLLDVLVKLFTSNKHADFVAICQCLIKLNRPEDIGRLLDRLMSHANGDLIAYQIAFDLYENASQQFNTQVLNTYASFHQPSPSTPTVKKESDSAPTAKLLKKRRKEHRTGRETVKHHMQFLIKNNHTDMLILKEMKDCVRTATAHNATLMSNGLMHLGTTCDDFLRDNLDWISKATNWNKFNAVATLGLIHKVYLQLRDALYLDDAVSGEAAGLAMGLVMVGSLNSAAFQDMVQYTCDTQHDNVNEECDERISCRQDEAESFIAQLVDVKSNAMLRSTGIAMMSMAYVGSGRANVVSRLLEKVATDPNNDVKRFAVMG